MTARPPARRYSEEEAREILRRAAERQQAEDDKTPHADLLDAAREVGIDPDHFDAAADEVARERHEGAHVEPGHARDSHGATRDEVAAYRREQRQGFLYRLGLFVVVIGALGALDSWTGGGWWVQWVALVWGALLAIRGVRLLRPESDLRRDLEKSKRRERKSVERQLRERARQEQKHERRRRKHERRRPAGASKEDRRRAEREFEEAVEAGVSALLAHVARRLNAAASRKAGALNVAVAAKADAVNDSVAAKSRELGEALSVDSGGAREDTPSAARVRVERPDGGPPEEAEAEAELPPGQDRERERR